MRAILCMLLLWQTCAPLCMPRPIGLPYFTSTLRWQTCTSLCMPRPISLAYFTLSLLWQTCMPLCTPRQISLLYLTSSPLWQTCAPLCMPHQIGLPYFTSPLRWLALTPFTLHVLAADLHLFSFSQDFDTAFAAAVMAPALVTAMIQTRHDTNWKLVVAEEVSPKDFAMMILWVRIF
jgi:hypothetical protein